MTVTESVLGTPAGTIVGRQVGSVRRYLGIPYAEAPTGARRFAAREYGRPLVADTRGVYDPVKGGEPC